MQAMKPNDEETDELERAARRLLVTKRPFDRDEVEWALRGIGVTSPADVLTIAPELVDRALEIFDREIRPFLWAEFPLEICYAICSPKCRCRREFAYGISVEHTAEGRWACEGREFSTKEAAESAAKKAVLLLDLRSEFQRRQHSPRTGQPRFAYAQGRKP